MKKNSPIPSLFLVWILPLSLLLGCVTDGSRKEEKFSLESCKEKLATGALSLAKEKENRFFREKSQRSPPYVVGELRRLNTGTLLGMIGQTIMP